MATVAEMGPVIFHHEVTTFQVGFWTFVVVALVRFLVGLDRGGRGNGGGADGGGRGGHGVTSVMAAEAHMTGPSHAT